MSTDNTKPTTAAAAAATADNSPAKQQATANTVKKAAPVAAPKTAASEKPTPAPKTAAAKTATATKVEADANPTPPKHSPTKKAAREVVTTKATVNTNMMVTLDLTGEQFDRNAGIVPENVMSKSLSKVLDREGHAHNLWAPFRGVSQKQKAKDPTAARGLIRSALASVLSITAAEPATNYVGTVEDVTAILDSLAAQIRDRVQAALGFQPEDIVFEYLPERTEEEIAENVEQTVRSIVTFGELIRVSAWASARNLNVADPETSLEANIIVNVTVRAGSLFTATELDNAVQQALTFLEATNEKVGGDPLMVSILNRANAIGNEQRRALFDTLAESGYDVVDRRELEDANLDADWLCAVNELDTKLLVPDADILHMNVLGLDEEADDSEEAEGDE